MSFTKLMLEHSGGSVHYQHFMPPDAVKTEGFCNDRKVIFIFTAVLLDGQLRVKTARYRTNGMGARGMGVASIVCWIAEGMEISKLEEMTLDDLREAIGDVVPGTDYPDWDKVVETIYSTFSKMLGVLKETPLK